MMHDTYNVKLLEYKLKGMRSKEGFLIYITLKSFQTIQCTDTGNVWEFKGPCSALRPAMKGT